MKASLPWARPGFALELLDFPEWLDGALCGELEEEDADATFFPQRGQRATLTTAMCSACPVPQQCLEHALEVDAEFGVWGA